MEGTVYLLMLPNKETRPETIGYALLDEVGVPYARQVRFAGKFIPDATIASRRIIVQFDGDYWHDKAGTSTEARIRARVRSDKVQDAFLARMGWRVIRFWESDLLTNPNECLQRMRREILAASVVSDVMWRLLSD